MIEILSGPAGSGKTSVLLDRVRANLQAGRPFHFLLPDAASAKSVRLRLAREGHVLNPHRIVALSTFIAQLAPAYREANSAECGFALRDSLRKLRPSIFEPIRHLGGFQSRLLNLIYEFSAGGISPSTLASACAAENLATSEISAFVAVYRQLHHAIEHRGWKLPGDWLSLALPRASTLKGEIILDGFYELSLPLRQFLLVFGQSLDVRLSLPDAWPGAISARQALEAYGATVTTLSGRSSSARIAKVAAPRRSEEIEEIARRILEFRKVGRGFHEMAVVVRTGHPYTPLLQSTFSRFEIPARFHFSTPLASQSLIRLLDAVVSSLISGWDHARLTEVVRLLPSTESSGDRDALEFDLLRLTPGAGLDGCGDLATLLTDIGSWRYASRTPHDWSATIQGLASIVRPKASSMPANHDEALRWRAQADALRLWRETLVGVAAYLPPEPMPLEAFWLEATEAIRMTPFRLDDRRGNVVQVMSAWEARALRVPIVFVCGLLEGEFPGQPAPNAVFHDAARESLRTQGIDLRTRDQARIEEDLLLRTVMERSEEAVVLTWPEFDERGGSTMPSFALDGNAATVDAFRPCRPKPLLERRPVRHPDFVPSKRIEARHGESKKWSPSEIQTFLKCPYQYFGTRTLRLLEPPKPPDRRFGPLEQGSLAHEVLRLIHERPDVGLEETFDRAFRAKCRTLNISLTHRIEWDRQALLRSLRGFLDSFGVAGSGATHVETEVIFPLTDDIVVRGRIDRYDENADGEVTAIDYKYSNTEGAKRVARGEETVQGGLYLLALAALGKKPVRFIYVPLKGDATLQVQDNVAELMAEARSRTLDVVDRVRQGEVTVRPSSFTHCRWCLLKNACRIAEVGALEALTQAGESA